MAYAMPVTPRYLEVDRQGVVFHMWYLAYLDDALNGFLEHLGFPYPRLTTDGLDVMLVHTELDWRDGLRFGDPARVVVSCERVGTTSFTARFDVERGDDPAVVCVARTVYVLVSAPGKAKRVIPDRLRAALEGERPG